MLVRCVHCDSELVAPVRSEYWSNKHACHIWHCPKCCACFSSLVSFSDVTILSRYAVIVLGFAQQPRQFGDIRRNPSRLVFAK